MKNEALENGEFIIDSHRGAFKGGLLENSIPAFLEALDEGANVLECDIRRTKDDNIVLVHNSTIDHIAKNATFTPDVQEFGEEPVGKVRDHTVDYLKALKYENDASILTLEEFLHLLRDKKVGAQIELKEFGFEKQIITMLEGLDIDHDDLKGPIVFTSFNWFAILKLQKLLWKTNLPKHDFFNKKKGFCAGLQAIPLGSFIGKWVLRQCKKNKIWGFMTYYKYLPISRIEYAHQCGVKFCPRVPDNEELIKSYINANVDGFETDNVPLIKKCITDEGYQFDG
ncbi:MAG: glycerophosphodiester phosphodiesterase [Candidatus Hodarchaeota archaeon]